MSITTDEDIRDLLWRMGKTPAEIEVFTPAFPEIRQFIDVFNKLMAERLARRLVEQLFPEWTK